MPVQAAALVGEQGGQLGQEQAPELGVLAREADQTIITVILTLEQ